MGDTMEDTMGVLWEYYGSTTVTIVIVAMGEQCDVMHKAIRNRNGGRGEA